MFKDKQEEKFYREATNTFCNYSDPYASYSEHMWKAGCDYTKDKLIALGWTPPGNNQHNNAEIHIKNTVIQQCIDILVAASNRSRHNPNTKMALDSCARSIFMLGELDKDEDGELFLVQQAVQAEPVEQDPIYIVGSGWQCDAYPTLGTKLYTEAPAVAQGEPVHFRAVLCSEQQNQAIGVTPKVVGFVDKKAAEQFILEKRDFQGWGYSLEPLYGEAQAVAVNEQMYEALQVADRFCGSLTSDECSDSVHIPIRDAIAAYKKIKRGV